MRVYLPAGDLQPKSIPCVLIAPAGSTLLQGNSIDDPDYHDETLPYAEAGMAVVNFSLDGGILEVDSNIAVQLTSAYLRFRAALAGVVNGRNAVEFALAKIPSVDPKRIYTAGHSSAGTAALLLAAHEPRLAGSIGFAPCSDLEARLGELNGFVSRTFLYDLTQFIKQTSPKTHVSQINCPVFLFHAEDDGNVPVEDTRSFASELKRLGKTVELKIVPTGDHYDSMIKEGVPAAIEWLKLRQSP